ncbi:hypothetical protein AVEN_124082-1, partial [Araneus ventricosus]
DLRKFYVFFSGSTHRCTILLTNVKVAVSDFQKKPRWSAHYEAVKSVFKKTVDAIEELCDAPETIETRGAAQTLLPEMRDFSFSCYWNNVLKEVNHVQKYLQILGISFEKFFIKMRDLKVFLKYKRNDLVEEALQFAKDACEEMGIPVVKSRDV